MKRKLNLDLDVIRTFVVGMDAESFAKAAERLGRSTSAVSAQLKKLEEQTQTPLFRKSGRGLALTDAGETMFAYGRRLLELNDEAVVAVQGVQLEGWVRLGLQEDFGETLLPDVLGRFSRAHPKVKVEARVSRNAELVDAVTSGRLDLALAWSNGATTAHCQPLMKVPLCWIGSRQYLDLLRPDEPVPLLALDNPCLMREIATRALNDAGRPWRIAFVGSSLASLWAAAAAGLGITVRTSLWLPNKVDQLSPVDADLPPLPSLGLTLHRSQAELPSAANALASIVATSLSSSI
ncbi:LysR substrate-binding domain-containing protein [Neorhizobium sp. NPDC001467]|uniref:LysR substrate-binding domain-containing protein n=1 Tax=Neorhizobium sp. NPDC001467 TaxID=3390595 RepID=UPI003D013118